MLRQQSLVEIHYGLCYHSIKQGSPFNSSCMNTVIKKTLYGLPGLLDMDLSRLLQE